MQPARRGISPLAAALFLLASIFLLEATTQRATADAAQGAGSSHDQTRIARYVTLDASTETPTPTPVLQTITKAFEFGSSSEGWVAKTPLPTGSTAVFNASGGCPAAGSLQVSTSGANRSNTVAWQLDQTWEQLGVPAGHLGPQRTTDPRAEGRGGFRSRAPGPSACE